MVRAELIFIPSPGVGHLLPIVELAKLLASRDEQISITILIMKLPFESDRAEFTQNLKKDAPEHITFVDIPDVDETTRTKLMSLPRMSFFNSFVESQRTQVRDVVAKIFKNSKSGKIGGFVIDMLCTSMIDVVNEFNVPAYVFFTSGAAFLSLMFYVQNLKDNESQEVHEYKDSDVKLSPPGFRNPVPVKVLPSVMLSKDGFPGVIAMTRRLRKANAILVNTVRELEAHAIKSLAGDENTPLIYHVGPIIHSISGGGVMNSNKSAEEDIICWLNRQPLLSVVYLCFGSIGSFDTAQVTEIAQALELSGHRFLWSLRRPSQETETTELLTDYEDYNEVLSEGFLKRTSGIGKVIGWAPQMSILSHPSVGGFVSHCGWNSALESTWCGVPMATWPMYAEQQTNAFQLVKELELAAEIKMDYRKDSLVSSEPSTLVTAKEIERGINCLMDGESQMRTNMKQMKIICRKAIVEGGSSHTSLGKFIQAVMDNISL